MNEHKNIITIEDEIKEFSDKPVKSSALYKKVKDLESGAVPDSSSANVGDVLTKGEDGIGWSAPSGGGVFIVNITSSGSGYLVTDKGADEIWEATKTGLVILIGQFTHAVISEVDHFSGTTYYISFYEADSDKMLLYSADTSVDPTEWNAV